MNTDLQKRTLTMMGWEAVPYHDGIKLTHYWLDHNKKERSAPDITLDMLMDWADKEFIDNFVEIKFGWYHSSDKAETSALIILDGEYREIETGPTRIEALSEALLAMAKEGADDTL